MTEKLILKEKIFIAGSSGMVGSAIKRAYLKIGFHKDYLLKNLLTPTHSELDLTNYEIVDKWFQINKPTIVIIAAAKVGGIYANQNQPADFILDNLKIQTNIIELSWKYNIKTLLFLGSSCIYPKFSPQPIKEEYLMTDQLEQTNEFYALAKIAGIKLCQALNQQHKFNSICLMPTNLFGPGDNYHSLNSHVIPGLIKRFHDAKKSNSKYIKCWGSGTPLREFLYVDDLADACLFILDKWNSSKGRVPKDKKGKEIYWLNVGSPFEISIKDLAKKIAEEIGFEGEILWDKDMPDGTPRKKLDTSKINALGWEAKTNLEEGIRLTLSHFEKEMSNQTIRN